MANDTNKINRSTSLADLFGTPVSDGTFGDVVETPKVDRPGKEVPASRSQNAGGQLWANLVDDAIKRVVEGYYRGLKLWTAADATERDGLGSADGLAVDDLLFQRDAAALYVAATVGATESTWTALTPEPPSAVVDASRVQGSTARGSTNDQIFRWTTEVEQSGTAITYTDSASLGGYWAIAEAGIYSVSVSLDAGSDGAVAIKVAGALSNTLMEASIRAFAYDGSTGAQPLSTAWTGPIAAGEIVWIAGYSQDPGNVTGSAFAKTCTICRVG